MDNTLLCVLLLLSILIYCGHCGEDDERCEAVLTLQPNWTQIFSEETVTMRCDIQGGRDSDWQYEWHNNRKLVYSNKKPEYRISPVYTFNSGSYTCEGVKGIKRSETSDPVQLTVSALPSASVSVSAPGPLYYGDTVSLQCDIPDYTDLMYYWYKNNQPGYSTHGKTLTISLPDQDGQYQCWGTRRDRPQKSQLSRALSIQLTALPTASVSVSPQGLLYSGETVSLQCDIPDYTDWTYHWSRNNQPGSGTHGKTINISLPDQDGQYQCLGTRRDRPQKSQLSGTVLIRSTALPKAELSVEPNPVFPGETVTLTCSVESDSIWNYQWYKDRNDNVVPQSVRHTITGDTLTISRVTESDQGLDWCQGERRSRPTSSQHSNVITLTVTDYQPSTTLTSDKEDVFTGDSVTLSCTVESSGWTFYWYRHRPDSTPVTTTSGYSYTLSWVSVSDGGQYWCRAGRGDPVYYTLYSDPVQINITDKPKAVLSISPQWLNPGDSVTLSCEVDKTSTGWRFSWYRTVPYRAGLPSLSDKSYSLLPQSDNVTSEDSYTLIPAGPTPTGGYVCRAERGDPVYNTLFSEPQFLWSGDLQPSVSLRISPNTTQHFRSKSLSLSCEEKGNSTGWRLMRYTERGVESGCVSNWGSITGSTCTIRSTYTWFSGVFWCESGSGEYSNAVNITVDDGYVILESPVHPMTEGDSVTLTCKYWTTSSNIKADFYKDGVLIKNETTGEMTIPAVSKSDEGFYKCKSPDKGESPESWMTVRVVSPGSSTSVLVGVVVGLVVAGVLLVILLVLLWRFKNTKGSCFNRIFSNPQPQSTNQDPQQDQGSTQGRAPDAGYTLLQHDGGHIYDTINPSDNNVNDAAAGPSHVTYAQIQLKKLDKKKKEKPADPKESPVYSEVQTGKATAAGPVDVTYAEVVLKKKTKAKKKRETTPPEADSVYSQLKPDTTPGP
ncbi:B-cell receptor CD22 [Salmo salar]|uniref:B-cell receptor CD22 n=1 Tax=Salmo salar TaxID=8030 RepID=A0ABM3DEY6_SALSA|nr:B-cell receptor CD22-like [Salmo salar]